MLQDEEVVEVVGILVDEVTRPASKTLEKLFEQLRKLRAKEEEVLSKIFDRLAKEPGVALPIDIFGADVIMGEEILDPE